MLPHRWVCLGVLQFLSVWLFFCYSILYSTTNLYFYPYCISSCENVINSLLTYSSRSWTNKISCGVEMRTMQFFFFLTRNWNLFNKVSNKKRDLSLSQFEYYKHLNSYCKIKTVIIFLTIVLFAINEIEILLILKIGGFPPTHTHTSYGLGVSRHLFISSL